MANGKVSGVEVQGTVHRHGLLQQNQDGVLERKGCVDPFSRDAIQGHTQISALCQTGSGSTILRISCSMLKTMDLFQSWLRVSEIESFFPAAEVLSTAR